MEQDTVDTNGLSQPVDPADVVNPETGLADPTLRDEIAVGWKSLREFFTRRETDYWPTRSRSKYEPHRGATEMLRAETGLSRSQAREAVRQFHRDREKGATSGEA